MFVIKSNDGYFVQSHDYGRNPETHRPYRGWTTNINKARTFRTANGAHIAYRKCWPTGGPAYFLAPVEVTVKVTETRNTVPA